MVIRRQYVTVADFRNKHREYRQTSRMYGKRSEILWARKTRLENRIENAMGRLTVRRSKKFKRRHTGKRRGTSLSDRIENLMGELTVLEGDIRRNRLAFITKLHKQEEQLARLYKHLSRADRAMIRTEFKFGGPP